MNRNEIVTLHSNNIWNGPARLFNNNGHSCSGKGATCNVQASNNKCYNAVIEVGGILESM